jgi:hypothetical protein
MSGYVERGFGGAVGVGCCIGNWRYRGQWIRGVRMVWVSLLAMDLEAKSQMHFEFGLFRCRVGEWQAARDSVRLKWR